MTTHHSSRPGGLGWRQARAAASRKRPSELRASAPESGRLPAVEATGHWGLASRLVYLIVALYALTFVSLSFRTHDAFATHAFDLGNMDQAVWNTFQGRPFQFTNWEGGTTRLAAHVEPILLLVAQLYRIADDPKTLLALQSVVIASGALPAFWLARNRLRHEVAAVTFAAVYLLYPGLEAANLAEFHAVALSSAFLLFAFYFATRRQYPPFVLFSILAMSTKEQVPLAVLLLGLYVVVVQRSPRIGAAVAVLAAVWFVIAVGVVIPLNNPAGASPYLSRYDHVGGDPLALLQRLFTRPDSVLALLQEPARLDYLRGLFVPVAYLALLSPPTLVMALPDIALNVLSSFSWMYSGTAQYGAVIAPFVVISAIEGARYVAAVLGRVHAVARRLGLYVLSGVVLFFSVTSYYQMVFLPLTEHLPEVTPHHQLAAEFIRLIPPTAGVAASSTLNPHVAHRERLSLFPEIKGADYIFLDASATPHPIDSPSQRWRIENLLREDWGVVGAQDGLLLLRRGEMAKDVPDAFYSFARVARPQIQHPLDVTFGDAVRLLGYDVVAGPVVHGFDARAHLIFYWQVTRPTDRNYALGLNLVGPDPKLRSWWASEAATTWYPTSRWAAGETVRVDVPRLPLEGQAWADVYLAVADSQTSNDPSQRLLPVVAVNSTGARLTSDGTMLWLMRITRG